MTHYKGKVFNNKEFASKIKEAVKAGVKTNAEFNKFLGV